MICRHRLQEKTEHHRPKSSITNGNGGRGLWRFGSEWILFCFSFELPFLFFSALTPPRREERDQVAERRSSRQILTTALSSLLRENNPGPSPAGTLNLLHAVVSHDQVPKWYSTISFANNAVIDTTYVKFDFSFGSPISCLPPAASRHPYPYPLKYGTPFPSLHYCSRCTSCTHLTSIVPLSESPFLIRIPQLRG